MSLSVFSSASLLAVNTMPLARAASAYAEQGLAVFPLATRAKVPRVANGFYRATTDRDQIRRWWSRWPDANIGLTTGHASGLWVLDIDPRHDGLASLEILDRHARAWGAVRPLRETLCQVTGGGGLHLAYTMPERSGVDPPNGVFAGYAGIDLKKGGGYIVAAPSIHPGGLAYQWQNALAPAPFPSALLELWVEAQQRALARASPPSAATLRTRQARESPQDREADPQYWLHAALRHAAPGCRHNYACFLAIQLVRVARCDFEEAARWMGEYVARVPQGPGCDPYEWEDALECLRYAWRRYGPASTS